MANTGSARRKTRSEWEKSSNSSQFSWGGLETRAEWFPEPDVGRVANGVPNRVDRLKAIGNAIVPQVVVPIMQCIKAIDDKL